ncbi:FAD-dependent oxidoreductase [Lacisediminihabitans profunda]|uniref:FAD-dependent oxidoreductase n=2 Tax=Lacisediminihabitans profunda TaxID=2594790 RepID=A0A5C8UVZ1_9MICO|nr:FAD-dependent oxidoreductase [Lacisediminihabitans profunda]
MGSATARELARRGRQVTLLERFSPGHLNGASHGASRNFNVSYADPTYVAMLAEALPAWRELETETGDDLLDLVGIVNHGANPAFAEVKRALDGAGIPAEFLPPGEAGRRWPGIRFDREVLFTPQAGRLHAERSVAALQRSAVDHSAEVLHGRRVLELTVLGDDEVRLRVEDTVSGAVETITARRVVVTVGAWTTKLLTGILPLPRLVVTQEQPAHFRVLDDTLDWPGFNHSPDPEDADYAFWPSPIYGMFTPGQGVKAGWHGVGPQTDPDSRTFSPEPVQLAALQRYAQEWLPGVDPHDLVPISCTYTTSLDSNFVLDAVGPVVVGAGFSGHGFKFTPTVGRILADLADGVSSAPRPFALDARR